jgi:hypothetical protein
VCLILKNGTLLLCQEHNKVRGTYNSSELSIRVIFVLAFYGPFSCMLTSPNPAVVRLNIVKARNQFAVAVKERHFYQAEVLVPSPVPPELIIFPASVDEKKKVESSMPSMKPTVVEINAGKQVESGMTMKPPERSLALSEVKSSMLIMKPEAVKVEEVQCPMSIMNPEASNASKQNSIMIPAKHSHSQAMNVVVLGSTHKNTTTPYRTKPNEEEEEAEKLVVEEAKEEKVRRADCGQGSLMLLPKEKHKNHEQQHAHSLNVNEPCFKSRL